MSRRDELVASALTREEWLNQHAASDRYDDGVKARVSQYSLPAPYKARGIVKEAEVLKATQAALKTLKIWHRRIQVQGTIQHTGKGSAVMRPSTMLGMPDILGVLPDGRLLAIEVKAPGGHVSSIQMQTLTELKNSRAKVCVLVNPEKLSPWLVAISWNLKLEGIDVV